MAVIQISKIQHRRGLRIDVPGPLNDAEFGWAEDTKNYLSVMVHFMMETRNF